MKSTLWPTRLFERDWPPMTNLFERFPETLIPTREEEGTVLPAVNIAEDDRAMTFSFEMPGLEEKDIDVQILGNQLLVKAERHFEEEKKDKEFHRIEHRYGKVTRSVTLPQGLTRETDRVSAVYKRGILTVTLPKIEEQPRTRIKVKGS